MTNVWYTSDLHLFHKFVAEKRGFVSTQAHNEALALRWNNHVAENDIVWVLGDVGLGKPMDVLAAVTGLHGRKHLIEGNHDPLWAGHRRGYKHQAPWLQVFETVQPFAVHQIGEHRVLLSHFPYEGDTEGRAADRYTQFRLRDEGRWLLHGHTHGKERQHGRQIHVGLDAWDLTPVPLGTIAKMIGSADRPGVITGSQPQGMTDGADFQIEGGETP